MQILPFAMQQHALRPLIGQFNLIYTHIYIAFFTPGVNRDAFRFAVTQNQTG
jgi:hypothetical protein